MLPNFITRIVQLFNQKPDISKMGFLSSFFKTSSDSFTDAEKFEYDITRSGEDVAPVVRNLSTGAVLIAEDEFQSKSIPFPVHALAKPANIAKLMKRQPGENAYAEKVNWFGKLAKILVDGFAKMTAMIRCSVELQAAQLLQTGKIILTDEKGNATYELDLKPKASHFPTAAIAWGASGANVQADITALADVIRDDGFCDVTTLIFGKNAWEKFIADPSVQTALRQDGLRLGMLNPALKDKGGKYMGYIDIGANRYDLWVYNARYNEFGKTAKTKYVHDDKVIFLPDIEDLDFRKMFGGIPTINTDETFGQLFDGKIQIGEEFDFRPRVWWDAEREAYIGEIKSRPLCWPFSIDRFGCLTIR